MAFATLLDQAFKARLPLLYVETSEEVRVIGEIRAAARGLRNPRRVWTWSSAVGLVDPDEKAVPNTMHPTQALDHALGVGGNDVFVFCDLHAYFGTDQRPGEPVIIRKVRETALEFRHGDAARALVVVAPGPWARVQHTRKPPTRC